MPLLEVVVSSAQINYRRLIAHTVVAVAAAIDAARNIHFVHADNMAAAAAVEQLALASCVFSAARQTV